MLIINADDWGRNTTATDRSMECFHRRRITSASLMVFMADSERAVDLALSSQMGLGLHVNFTESFNGTTVPAEIRQQQEQLRRFLLHGKYALLMYNPWLRKQFANVFRAQYLEFTRLLGHAPTHVDGHQHMHLCTNVLIQGLIPRGYTVRRNFTFRPGERGFMQRTYRQLVDRFLSRRHIVSDYFFALSDYLGTGALDRIFDLSREANVELMTHPEQPAEQALLMTSAFAERAWSVPSGDYSMIARRPA